MTEQTHIPASVAVGDLPTAGFERAGKMVALARAIVITDQAGYDMAAMDTRNFLAHRDVLDAERRKIVDPLNQVVKHVNDRFRGPIADCEGAITVIKDAMLGWSQEQARIAAEARRRAQEEADKARRDAERRAAEERAKADAKARQERDEAFRQKQAADEAARVAREARERAQAAQDDAARKLAQDEARAADKARLEAEAAERKALAAAEKTQEQGDRKADEAIQKGLEAALVPAPQEQAKTAGVATTTTWAAELTDIKALCRAVADGHASPTLVEFSQKQGNQFARATKGAMPVPGVRFFPQSGVTIRGSK